MTGLTPSEKVAIKSEIKFAEKNIKAIKKEIKKKYSDGNYVQEKSIKISVAMRAISRIL